jgi:GDP-mannose pyrophosphatase NudK
MSTTDIRNMEKTLLSDSWYTLNKFSFELKDKNGQ